MKVVHLCDLKAHQQSKCTVKTCTIQQSITLDHILQQPVSAPPTKIELRLLAMWFIGFLHSPQLHLVCQLVGITNISLVNQMHTYFIANYIGEGNQVNCSI